MAPRNNRRERENKGEVDNERWMEKKNKKKVRWLWNLNQYGDTHIYIYIYYVYTSLYRSTRLVVLKLILKLNMLVLKLTLKLKLTEVVCGVGAADVTFLVRRRSAATLVLRRLEQQQRRVLFLHLVGEKPSASTAIGRACAWLFCWTRSPLPTCIYI